MKKQLFSFLVLLIVGGIMSFAEKGTVIDTDEAIQSVLSIDDCEAVAVYSEICNVDIKSVTDLIKSTNLKRDTDLIVSIVVVEQESRGSPTSVNVIPLAITLKQIKGLSSGGLSYMWHLT